MNKSRVFFFAFSCVEVVPAETQLASPRPPPDAHSALPTRPLGGTETPVIRSSLPTERLLDSRETGHTGALLFIFAELMCVIFE